MNAPEPTKSRSGRDLLLVFALLAAGVVTGGYFYHRSYERHYRAEVERQLSAIADMKVAQIIQWRRERLADANLIRATPYYPRRALDALAQLDSARTRQMFTGGLGPLLANGRYDRMLLLDEQLDVRLVHPEGSSRALAGAVRGPAEQALRTRQVVMTDLHRAADGVAVHLELLVPLVVRREGANDNVPAAGLDPSPADRSTGVLVLQINPQEYLFPLLQAWPTSSRTAETLLVRREGNDVVFLNELRFQTNTALNLRVPLDRVGLPAAQAALGREGTMTGVDCRGVGVVAVTRVIPDSPWALVARMDTAEVYAPIREELWQVIVLIAALLLGAGASVGLVGRQQRLRFYRQEAAAVAQLRESESKFRTLLENVPQKIFLKDRAGRWLSVNENFARDLGLRPEAVEGKTDHDCFPKELADKYRDDDERVMRTGQSEELEEKHVRDGRETWVRVIKRPVRDGRGEITGVLGIYWDNTERNRAEEFRRQQAEELRAHNEQLTRFNRAAVGRELRMIELKREINELCGLAGQPPRYTVDSDAPSSQP